MESNPGKLQAPVRKLTGIQVLGVGSHVPLRVVTNADLAAGLGVDAAWVEQRTGILERRQAGPGESTADLAAAAGEAAIAAAGVDRSQIDLLLVATFTPDFLCPATACLVQDRLGLSAAACDINAACSGFVYALVTGMQYVASGCSKYCLVIGADCNTRVVNPQDVKVYPLFGDGAGAVLLGRGEADQGLWAYTLGSDGAGAKFLWRPVGGTNRPYQPECALRGEQYLVMEGRSVFRWAVRVVEESTNAVLQATGLGLEQIDWVIWHQANERIIHAAADVLGLPREKLIVNLQRYGNTSAGSIPLALDEALRDGRIQPGQRLLISGFGAGLTWGTAVWHW